jgi:hypothetical protein
MSLDNDAKHSSAPSGTPAAKPATRVRIIDDGEATGETAAAYDFWRAGSGRQQVPGIIKCFGARPDFLRRIIELGNTIHFSEGHLSRRHKEMIASYVSYLNRSRIDWTATLTSCVFRELPINVWRQSSKASSMTQALQLRNVRCWNMWN